MGIGKSVSLRTKRSYLEIAAAFGLAMTVGVSLRTLPVSLRAKRSNLWPSMPERDRHGLRPRDDGEYVRDDGKMMLAMTGTMIAMTGG